VNWHAKCEKLIRYNDGRVEEVVEEAQKAVNETL